MAKQKTINREFKTVFFDYDGTMFDTAGADQYVARQKTLRRSSNVPCMMVGSRSSTTSKRTTSKLLLCQAITAKF